MAKIFGKEYSKDEILKRVGSLSQICGTKLYEYSDGPARGLRGIEFRTGSGFDFNVVVDRGMDISSASYQGIPLAWRSANEEVQGAFYDPKGMGWLKTFFGGLLTTCGLTFAGAPSVDGEEELGLHGRYSTIPARLTTLEGKWEGDQYIMTAKGQVEEVSVFGDKLRLTRTITTELGAGSLSINDVTENIGSQKSPLMMIYHINGGFPVVDESTRLISTSVIVESVDDNARGGKQEYDRFSAPIRGISEKCYAHTMKSDENGNAYVSLVNEEFDGGRGIGLYTRYSTANLPRLIEWKMMGEGEYVVGTEPGNCFTGGRAAERAAGTLKEIEPGQIVENNLEIGVLASPDDISGFKKKVDEVLGADKVTIK